MKKTIILAVTLLLNLHLLAQGDEVTHTRFSTPNYTKPLMPENNDPLLIEELSTIAYDSLGTLVYRLAPPTKFPIGVDDAEKADENNLTTNVYPNPSFAGGVKVSIEGGGSTIATISLLDITGQLIQQQIVTLLDRTVHHINTSDLTQGAYIVLVDNGKEKVTTKLFVKA